MTTRKSPRLGAHEGDAGRGLVSWPDRPHDALLLLKEVLRGVPVMPAEERKLLDETFHSWRPEWTRRTEPLEEINLRRKLH